MASPVPRIPDAFSTENLEFYRCRIRAVSWIIFLNPSMIPWLMIVTRPKQIDTPFISWFITLRFVGCSLFLDRFSNRDAALGGSRRIFFNWGGLRPVGVYRVCRVCPWGTWGTWNDHWEIIWAKQGHFYQPYGWEWFIAPIYFWWRLGDGEDDFLFLPSRGIHWGWVQLPIITIILAYDWGNNHPFTSYFRVQCGAPKR